MQRTVQDIPDSEINFVLATIKADGGTLVSKIRQDDGRWTVTSTFPDASGGKATTHSAPAAAVAVHHGTAVGCGRRVGADPLGRGARRRPAGHGGRRLRGYESG